MPSARGGGGRGALGPPRRRAHHIDYCYLAQTHRDDCGLQAEEIAGTHWRPVTAIGNPDLRAAVQAALAARASAVPAGER